MRGLFGGTATGAKAEPHKPSWASLSSTGAPSLQTSLGDSNLVPGTGTGTLNLPPGLQHCQPLPEGSDAVIAREPDLAKENARLALENEMLRLQVLQATQAQAAGSAYLPEQGAQAIAPPVAAATPASGAAAAASAKAEAAKVPTGPKTTIMFRNVPCDRDAVLQLLEAEGFHAQYDFVYLPIDFQSSAPLGYAFVNLVDTESAERCWNVFEGYTKWPSPSPKVCSVNWSAPIQGLAEHVERFRNSPVMHESVPDNHRPVLYSDGVRIQFPPPTKKLRPPRVRPGRNHTGETGAAAPEA